jgi:DHA3 family macrolide efflux protein-like MFS transporter
MNRLWTKNFTIITLGSIVSMLGNAVSGFAISYLVLDHTGSTFLYALFSVVYFLPKIAAPIVAGPLLDHYSRRKTIYILDFISSGIYLSLFFLLRTDYFSYPVLLMFTLFVGTIDGVYTVAYDSLYPNLVSPGNFTKAYSISSMIYPLAAFMVPVASMVINKFGAAPLFIFNALTFFIAACFETKIDYNEEYTKNGEKLTFGVTQFKKDFKEGIRYISDEKGLLTITTYFCITMFASSALQTLMLPFFKDNAALFSHIPIDSVTLYTFVAGCGVFGRLIGGAIHYWFKYPVQKKFFIAITVYTTITMLEAVDLYLPVYAMMISMFIEGIMGVTSYNIRISATQSYVPDSIRGRFNGTFQMLCTVGTIIGQLVSGALAEFYDVRLIVIGFMAVNMLAVIFVMYRGREHVKKIYNVQV